jgi:hypothetical protein
VPFRAEDFPQRILRVEFLFPSGKGGADLAEIRIYRLHPGQFVVRQFVILQRDA